MTADLRLLEGKPWSDWTDFIGSVTPPENQENVTLNNSSSRLKLKKSDMGIYGNYPDIEPFLLARCEYCGFKFKLAAIADHIELKHSDGKQEIKYVGNPVIEPDSKKHNRKNNKCKERVEVNSSAMGKESKKPPSGVSPLKKNVDVPMPQPVSSIDSSLANSTVHKPEKSSQVKVKKSKEDKNSVLSSKSVSSKVNGVTNHIILRKDKKSDSPKKPNSKQVSNSLDKSKEENGPKINSEETKKSDVRYTVNSSNENQSSVESVLRRKIIEKKKISVKVRTFNPDRHCGVVAKENAKPCTKSLECKSHSVFLKRSVCGRSKHFDALLADHRAIKDNVKQELHTESQVDNKKLSLIETVSDQSLLPPQKLPLSVCPPNNKSDAMMGEFSVSVNQQVTPPILKSEDNHIRFSLPVSINNPTLVSGLKSSLMKVDLVSNEKPRSNGVNLSNGLSKEIMRNLTRRLTQIPHHPPTTVLRRTIQKMKKKKTSTSKKSKVGSYSQWNPWYRHVGGLLSVNANVSCPPASRKIKNKVNLFSKGEHLNKKVKPNDFKQNIVSLKESTNSKTFCLDDLKEVYFKLHPDLKCALPYKIKNKNLLGITFPPFDTSFMIKVEPSADPQALFQNNFSGSGDSSSDSEKSDDVLEDEINHHFKLLTPISQRNSFLKLDTCGSPIVNCKHQSHSPLDSGEKHFNLGVGTLFNGRKVCLETVQRLQFVTPSGPVCVSLKHQPNLSELTKDFRTQSLDGLELIQPNLTGFTFPLEDDDLTNEIYMVS